VNAAKYKSLGDPELISLCLKGDSQAWESLILRYRRLIFSIPVKFSFSPSDCSDVFQSVCLRLIEHLGELKDESKVSGWLITTTTRQCIHVRAQKRRETSTEDEFEEPTDPAENVETVRIQTQAEQNVREAVEQLQERCRKLLELLYFDPKDPSYESIAQTMQMPVASIGPTRARCLDKLRMVLRRRGIREK
jgi:RNA polymerase sigma factor (sigma-70 family)